jgi:hypothetical protein
VKTIIWTPAEISEETVSIKPGLTVARRVSMKGVKSDETPDLQLDLIAEFSDKTRGYEITWLGIQPRRGHLKSDDLKEFKINEMKSFIIRALPTEQVAPMGRKEETEYLAIKAGDKDVLLYQVALRAAVARLASKGENLEVKECFDVSPATATRWIAAAQKAGLLDYVSA